jgi:hypothetical protein
MTASALPEPLEAFPIPEGAVVLEPGQNWDELSERELAIAALQQAMEERLLSLPLGPQSDLADPGRQLVLNRFAVQLICAGVLSDQIAVPLAPWQSEATAPQMVVAALVDSENGVVHWPGVLTSQEALAALRGAERHGTGEGATAVLEVESFQGGIERLFTLVQLLDPAALPRLALPSLARSVVQVRDWLSGQLDDLLAGLGGTLQPAFLAAGFRSTTAGTREGDQALALLSIPVGINPEGQLVSGDAARSCIERFRVLLIPSGSNAPEALLLRLIPEVEGDLLPADLTLSASQGSSSQSLSVSLSSQLDLRFPASDGLIEVSLIYPGSDPLVLPPLQLARP